MDWVSVLWAGGLGAAGGLLGGALSQAFPEKARGAVTTLAVVGAVALSRAISAEDAGRMTDQQWLVDLALDHDRSKFEASLDELPGLERELMVAIRDGDPALYGEIRDNAIRRARAGVSQEQIANETRLMIGEWTALRAPQLSDEEVAEILRILRAQLVMLEPEHSDVCANMMYGRPVGLFGEAQAPEGYLDLDVESYDIMFGSDLDGGELISPERANIMLGEIMVEVIEAHPETALPTFSVYNDPSMDPPEEACAVFITYFDRIIARPMPERARLWRTLLMMDQA